MKVNSISLVHAALLEQVDGELADQFLKHVSGYVDNIDSIENHYDELSQVRWMTYYWVSQLAAYNAPCFNQRSITLMTCRTMDEFIKVFNSVIIPCMVESGFAINQYIPILDMAHYAHTHVFDSSSG